jgi:hypothetical protein
MMIAETLSEDGKFEHRVSTHNRLAVGGTNYQGRFGWVQLWVCGGILLALALLLTSISTYLSVSRALIVEHLRGDLHSQAAAIEYQARRDSVQTSTELLMVLRQNVDKYNGRLVLLCYKQTF